MELRKILSKRPSRRALICHVCGDTARGMNFDVITCMSCKAFFRRHVIRSAKNLHCQLDDNCDINIHTRSGCSACRLKKCFALGMNPQLLRSSTQVQTQRQRKITEKENIWLPQPKSLSLLNYDHSTLTLDEWNLLSNIIHAYDEQNIVVRTQCSFKEQSSLPLKLRSKTSSTLELIGYYYTAIQPFIERSPYFHSLPRNVRKFIIQNNFNGTGGFNSVLAAAEANVFDNELHVAICNEIYGADYVKETQRLMGRIELNRTLLKLMLMILAFSSNCSIVMYDQSINLTNISAINSIYLIRIQDIFVTMLWKYLVYLYGNINAVKRFDHLVKNYLDTLKRMDENVSAQHWKMVDIIVEKTTNSLTFDN